MSEYAVGFTAAIGDIATEQGKCVLPLHRARPLSARAWIIAPTRLRLSATIAPLRGAVTQLAVVVDSHRATLPCFSSFPAGRHR
jgi:hypothetical protein